MSTLKPKNRPRFLENSGGFSGLQQIPYQHATYPKSAGSTVDMKIENQLDSVCRRQTARLLNHLRQTGQINSRLETDLLRAFRYVFGDVKKVVSGYSQENCHGQAEPR